MNVFILDKNMEKSAQYLDDAHLKAQINEACHILMANYNHRVYPFSKIGHINHPVTQFYSNDESRFELYSYLSILLREYELRFQKMHQNALWFIGFGQVARLIKSQYVDFFLVSKTYVNGSMTDDIDAVRHYIMTKPHTRPLTWTNRERPNWWEV